MKWPNFVRGKFSNLTSQARTWVSRIDISIAPGRARTYGLMFTLFMSLVYGLATLISLSNFPFPWPWYSTGIWLMAMVGFATVALRFTLLEASLKSWSSPTLDYFAWWGFKEIGLAAVLVAMVVIPLLLVIEPTLPAQFLMSVGKGLITATCLLLVIHLCLFQLQMVMGAKRAS